LTLYSLITKSVKAAFNSGIGLCKKIIKFSRNSSASEGLSPSSHTGALPLDPTGVLLPHTP